MQGIIFLPYLISHFKAAINICPYVHRFMYTPIYCSYICSCHEYSWNTTIDQSFSLQFVVPYIVLLYRCACHYKKGASWSWSYGSRIYNYLCNWCLLPLALWDRIPLWWVDKTFDLRQVGGFLWVRTPSSSTNKTDRHDTGITEILLKVALNAIT